MYDEDLNVAPKGRHREVGDEVSVDDEARVVDEARVDHAGQGAGGVAWPHHHSATHEARSGARQRTRVDVSATGSDVPLRGEEPPSTDAARGQPHARGDRRSRPRVVKRPLGEAVPVPPTGRITALHERRAGSTRYIVEVDGSPVATVSTELIATLALRVGRAMDEGLAARLRQAAGLLEVFDKAIAFLAIRARSARDLQLRLRRSGASPSAIAEVIDRLRALRVLDDEAYARNVARSRAISGGVSKRRITQELQRHGVDRSVADAAVAETLADVGLDEADAAMSVALRRMRALKSLDGRKQRQRLYAYLARRGYDSAVIAKVVATVVAGGAGGVGGADDGSSEP